MNTKHAVVSKGLFTWVLNGRYEEIPFDVSTFTLSQLCQVAVDNKLTHLWVMPDTGLVPNVGYFNAALDAWDLKATAWTVEQEVSERLEVPRLLRGVVGWLRSEKWQPQFNIIFTENTQWDFAHDVSLTPKKLLWVVTHLENKLGVPVGGGPSTVGWNYLKQVNEGHPEWLQAPATDMSTIPFAQSSGQIVWARVPTDEEMSKRVLVKIDKNSMYSRACVEERYGVGEPVHRVFITEDGTPTLAEPDIKQVGVWRITATHPYPNPFLPPALWDGAEWVATPIVKMLRKLGYTVTIYEAWVFPQSCPIMKQWAQNLWDFRKQYARDDLRNGAFKNIANETIGLASYRKFDEKVTDKKRPDIRCQTVAGAYAVMFYNMVKFAEEWGLYPVLVATDALVFCCDELPELKYQESLGGFKHMWTLPIDDEVRVILNSEKGPAMKMGKLNKIAKREM